MVLALSVFLIGMLIMQIIKNNRYNKMLEEQSFTENTNYVNTLDSKYIKQEKAKARKQP